MALLCALTVFVSSACAAQITTTLDVRSMATVDNLATDGWAWDAGSLTLTLSGVNIDAVECGMRLPAGTTIVLTNGSTNRISTRASGPANVGIKAFGDLTITNSSGAGSAGRLIITTATGDSTYGIHGNGNLLVKAGLISVTAANAAVQTYETYSCGVWFDGSITILGGSFSATAGNGPAQSYGIASGVSITIGEEGQPGPTVRAIGKDSSRRYSAGLMSRNITLNSGNITALAGVGGIGASSVWAWSGPTALVVSADLLPPGVVVGSAMMGTNNSSVLLDSSGGIMSNTVELNDGRPSTTTSASSVLTISLLVILALGVIAVGARKRGFASN